MRKVLFTSGPFHGNPIIRDGKHLLPSNKKKRFCCFIGTNNVIDLTSLSLSLR